MQRPTSRCCSVIRRPLITLPQLKYLVSRHRTVEGALAIPYTHLRSIATKEKNEANQEFLIIARH